MLTANDVQFAGEKWAPGWGTVQEQDKNKLFYLYTGFNYWLLTANDYNVDGWAGIKNITGYAGTINSTPVLSILYMKPVISVKAEALQYGKGTMDDPFRLETAVS